MKKKLRSRFSSLKPNRFKKKYPFVTALIITLLLQVSAFFFYYLFTQIDADISSGIWAIIKLPFLIIWSTIIFLVYNLLLVFPAVIASYKLAEHPKTKKMYDLKTRFITFSMLMHSIYTLFWFSLMGNGIVFVTFLDRNHLFSQKSRDWTFVSIHLITIILMSFLSWKWCKRSS